MDTQRLDRALVERGLASSRTRAAQLISSASVTVDGRPAAKSSERVRGDQRLEVSQSDPWVSRAAHKLLGALEACPNLEVAGRRCLDAGASTGGFTQVLLSAGARHVVAVDVGHGQMAPSLREDPRVENLEGLNLRHVESGQLGGPFGLIVADLSFISLQMVMEALAGQTSEGSDVLLMVKPQFEVGRKKLARTGVVSSPELRRKAVSDVVASAMSHGLRLRAVHRSQLPGHTGNLEFFVHLSRTDDVPHAAETTTAREADRLD